MSGEVYHSSPEVWPTGFSGAKYGLTVVTVSVIVFYLLGVIADRLRPKLAERQKWRWKNISVSLIHAVFSGVGSILW